MANLKQYLKSTFLRASWEAARQQFHTIPENWILSWYDTALRNIKKEIGCWVGVGWEVMISGSDKNVLLSEIAQEPWKKGVCNNTLFCPRNHISRSSDFLCWFRHHALTWHTGWPRHFLSRSSLLKECNLTYIHQYNSILFRYILFYCSFHITNFKVGTPTIITYVT